MSSITAGEAYVEVTCKTDDAKAQITDFSIAIASAAYNIQASEKDLSPNINTNPIDDAKKKIEEYKEAAKKVGATCESLFGKVLKITSSFAQTGDVFDKASQRIGISAQSLSELSYAANLSGTTLEQVEQSMKSLSQKLVDATSKGGDAADAFTSIGLSAATLSRMSPEEQFNKIADAIANIDDPTRRSAAAMKIFGDAGVQLLPLLSSGSDGINAMKQEARDLGVSVSDSAAKMSAEYNDAIARMTTVCDSLKMSLSEALLPVLTTAADSIKKISTYVSKFARENPTATKSIVGISAAVVGWVAAVSGLSRAFVVCSSACKTLWKSLKLLKNANVWILALTAAITAAGVAAAYYFSQKRDTDVWTDEKNKALEAGEAQREQDMERFHRLEELAAKESLTTSEIAEAARLASILNDTYGEIGVSVDTLTGKINIANGAQAKLNKEMMKQKAKELEAAIKEKNLVGANRSIDKKIAREMITDDDAKSANFWGMFRGEGLYDTLDDKRLAMLNDNAEFKARVHAEKTKNYNESKAMKAELDVLRKQLEEPETDEGFETPEEKAKKEEARKKRESAEYDLEYESASAEKKAQMSGAKLQEAEKALQDAKQGGNDEQIAEATRKYMSALRTYESDKGALDRENETKAKEEERQKQQEEEKQAKAKEDRQAAEDAYFDKNATLEERWNKSFGELQAAQQELTKAQEGGDNATIAAALRKLTGAQSKFETLDQEVQRQNEEGMAEETTNAIQKKVESTGTFSAYQAQAWGGGMDGQRKLYEENKRQTEYLRRLVDLMGSSSSVFV